MSFKSLQDAVGSAFEHFNDYESPAEEMLGERLRAALAPGAILEHQVWVETIAGRFRLDMRLTTPHGRRVAIEVDGRDFHDAKRDFWRSILIMGVGAVDSVYRVAASDLTRDLVGVLSSMASVEQGSFDSAHARQWRDAATPAWLYDETSDEVNENQDCSRTWSGRRLPAGVSAMRLLGHQSSYRRYYEFAQRSGAPDVDTLLAAWDAHCEHEN